jgi:hypothetical protein
MWLIAACCFSNKRRSNLPSRLNNHPIIVSTASSEPELWDVKREIQRIAVTPLGECLILRVLCIVWVNKNINQNRSINIIIYHTLLPVTANYEQNWATRVVTSFSKYPWLLSDPQYQRLIKTHSHNLVQNACSVWHNLQPRLLFTELTHAWESRVFLLWPHLLSL